MNFRRQKYISKQVSFSGTEIQELDYHSMHWCPKQIILRFWCAISLPPLESEPRRTVTRSQMGAKWVWRNQPLFLVNLEGELCRPPISHLRIQLIHPVTRREIRERQRTALHSVEPQTDCRRTSLGWRTVTPPTIAEPSGSRPVPSPPIRSVNHS